MSRWIFGLLGCLLMTLLFGCQPAVQYRSLLEEVQQKQQLVIGVKADSPPFGYRQNGKLQGVEIALAEKIATQIFGKKPMIKFVPVITSSRIPTLQAKQVDFILATMTITPERAEVVRFTQPYFHARKAIVVREHAPEKHVGDMTHKTISYVIGSTAEKSLKAALPNAKLMAYKTDVDAFQAFLQGRADGFSTDDSILIGLMKSHCGLRLLPERFSNEPYAIAFRQDAYSQSLYQKVDEILTQLRNKGELRRLDQAIWSQMADAEKPCPADLTSKRK